ncbi:hypothetical protein F5984_14040 [Rudanella paleaurantiibacter]|uniref:Uncharacterized protein n=2 Tax=Rudanella paleaurantiibacter TaxID=2614655 RepID=A0A7J5TZI7_9BACT|nr:hypothetical protein F5984_14040 [Rudanella paleaurantiibacter]
MAFLAGSVMAGWSASAQTNPVTSATPSTQLQAFSRGRVAHQRTLGLTLGSYALANMAVGALAAGRERTEAHYFHRMNVYWNLVNLGIAGLGLLGSRKADPDTETLAEAVRRHESMKQTLLFNAGLDVAYMAGGAYLIERGRHNSDKRDQFTGFGKSVIVQGGFLLVFDLVNYALFKKRGDRQQDALLGRTSDGIGLVIPLR